MLLAEHHQPITMTPGDLRHLLARYQRRLVELVDYCGADVSEYPGRDPLGPQGNTQ
jgi:hypothetical protein